MYKMIFKLYQNVSNFTIAVDVVFFHEFVHEFILMQLLIRSSYE